MGMGEQVLFWLDTRLLQDVGDNREKGDGSRIPKYFNSYFSYYIIFDEIWYLRKLRVLGML